MLIFIILAFAVEFCAVFQFLYNLIRYKYLGNTYIYVGIVFSFCLFSSLLININNGVTHPFVSIGASIFDSIKMAVAAFERETISGYFGGDGLSITFGVAYIITSIVTFGFISISVILSIAKIFANTIARTKNRLSKGSIIHYIFTDPHVSVSVRLAQELLKKKEGQPKNAVTVFVTRSSLKTQEGNEFRDSLIAKGIQVKAENFTKNLADKIIKKYFPRYFKKPCPFNKNVYIYCMFSDDETPTKVASNFEESIQENKTFIDLMNRKDSLTKEELDNLEKFKIFITYQDNDIDFLHGYSKNTLHIINTLSQYDMVSSEFMLENPINRFVDLNTISAEKDNQSMHVTFFGLGMINRPIFEKMTHAYQLWGDNINKINYHIIDRDAKSKAENCSNLYTDPKGKVFLYSVDYACDGEDLFEYEVIDRYVKSIKDKDNRFNAEGFELFVISLKNTNSDLKVAKNLKKALLKYVDKEKLKKTVIFLRIGEEEVALRLEKSDQKDFMKQEELDILNPNYKGVAPLVSFGENALMPQFISDHYSEIVRTGIVSNYAYEIQDNEESSSLTETDEKYLMVRRKWLKSNKFGFIKNTFVAFGIETKKALLNCQNLDDTQKVFGDKSEKRYLDYNIKDDKLIKLANLEHNRWMAANYLLEKAQPLDNDDTFPNFLKANAKYLAYKADPENVEKEDFVTKIDDGTNHVCMLNNNDLMKLYLFCKKHNLQEEGFKLVFLNDIKPIQKYFEIMFNKNKQ